MSDYRTQLMALRDDCLIAITDGRTLPWTALDNLPPWRAVLMARVAEKAGVGGERRGTAVTTADNLRDFAAKCGGSAGPGWLTAAVDAAWPDGAA